MKTIIFKPVLHIDMSEIDIDLDEDILGDCEQSHQDIYLGNTRYLNEPVDINLLMGQLQILIDHGANYVSILYHGDHIGYELDGQEVRLATQEEIDEEKRRHIESDMKVVNDRLKQNEKDRIALENALKKLLYVAPSKESGE